jgi:hypothetical protein
MRSFVPTCLYYILFAALGLVPELDARADTPILLGDLDTAPNSGNGTVAVATSSKIFFKRFGSGTRNGALG